MDVALLQPYDCLKPHPHQPRRYRYSNSVNSNLNNVNVNVNSNRSNRRRRNSPPPQQKPNGPVKAHQTRPISPPFMGQVRILKRGEQLPPEPEITRSNSGPVLKTGPNATSSLPRSLPEKEMVRSKSGPVHNGLPLYAGSAFITSPSPSEVPLPGFFVKNQVIASELRKVLKLV